VVALDEVAASGGDREELSRRREAVTPDDPALIIYTSGTTGPPKGCVLSHRDAMSVCSIVLETEMLLPGEVAYLYLPLAHVFAQTAQLAAFQVGAAIAYYGGDTKQIVPEIMEVHPDYLPSVPRIFEKLYALGMTQVPPEEQEELRRAVQLGVQVRALEVRGKPVPDELREPFERADERVFSKVRALFGGKLLEALSGGAPIVPEILEFLRGRRPRDGGLRDDRDDGRRHGEPPGRVPLRDSRAPRSGRRGPDRRGRRDPHARTPRLHGLLGG
jgi:long-chain acyl-CoA synthetase